MRVGFAQRRHARRGAAGAERREREVRPGAGAAADATDRHALRVGERGRRLRVRGVGDEELRARQLGDRRRLVDPNAGVQRREDGAELRAGDEEREHLEAGVGPHQHAIAVADALRRERGGEAICRGVELCVAPRPVAKGRGHVARHGLRVAPHDVADQHLHARQHGRRGGEMEARLDGTPINERPVRILSQVPLPLLARIGERFPKAELVPVASQGDVPAELRGDVLLTMAWGSPNLASILARGVRWVHAYGTGVDALPVRRARRIPLTCSRGASAIPIAEWVLAMMLAFEKRLPESWIHEPPEHWNIVDARRRSTAARSASSGSAASARRSRSARWRSGCSVRALPAHAAREPARRRRDRRPLDGLVCARRPPRDRGARDARDAPC